MSKGNSRAAGLAICARPGGPWPLGVRLGRRRRRRSSSPRPSRPPPPATSPSSVTGSHPTSTRATPATPPTPPTSCDAAVEDADLPPSMRPDVDAVAGRLVDEVNCPPPPPPPPPEPKKKPKQMSMATGTTGDQHIVPPGHVEARRLGAARPGEAEGGAGVNQHLGRARYELKDRLGPRRHGHRLLRAGPEARPRGRDQAARGQLRRRRRGAQAILARGPPRREARPSQHRPGVRRGRGRGPALHRHGAGRGRHAR